MKQKSHLWPIHRQEYLKTNHLQLNSRTYHMWLVKYTSLNMKSLKLFIGSATFVQNSTSRVPTTFLTTPYWMSTRPTTTFSRRLNFRLRWNRRLNAWHRTFVATFAKKNWSYNLESRRRLGALVFSEGLEIIFLSPAWEGSGSDIIMWMEITTDMIMQAPMNWRASLDNTISSGVVISWRLIMASGNKVNLNLK